MSYIWHFEVIIQYSAAFLSGLQTTIFLIAVVIFCSILLGIILAAISSEFIFPDLKKLIKIVIELFRAIPKLVLLVWIFYAFPILTGIHFPALETAIIALSLVSSAFIAEIIRAGIEAIPKGQIEAAKMLGLSNFQILSKVALPQAILRSIPSIMGECTTIIKDSTLAMFIGVNELLLQTTTASSISYRPLELYTALGAIFLIIILPLSWLSKKIEFKNMVKAASD